MSEQQSAALEALLEASWRMIEYQRRRVVEDSCRALQEATERVDRLFPPVQNTPTA